MAILPSDTVYFNGHANKEVYFDGHNCSEAWMELDGRLECVWRKQGHTPIPPLKNTGQYIWLGTTNISSYNRYKSLAAFNVKDDSASYIGSTTAFRNYEVIRTNFKYFFALRPRKTSVSGYCSISKDGISWETFAPPTGCSPLMIFPTEHGAIFYGSSSTTQNSNFYFKNAETEETKTFTIPSGLATGPIVRGNYCPAGVIVLGNDGVYAVTETQVHKLTDLLPEKREESKIIDGISYTATYTYSPIAMYYSNGQYRFFYHEYERDAATYSPSRYPIYNYTTQFVKTSFNMLDWGGPSVVVHGEVIVGLYETTRGFFKIVQKREINGSTLGEWYYEITHLSQDLMVVYSQKRLPNYVLINKFDNRYLVLNRQELPNFPEEVKSNYSYIRWSSSYDSSYGQDLFSYLSARYDVDKKQIVLAEGACFDCYYMEYGQSRDIVVIPDLLLEDTSKIKLLQTNYNGQLRVGDNAPEIPHY